MGVTVKHGRHGRASMCAYAGWTDESEAKVLLQVTRFGTRLGR